MNPYLKMPFLSLIFSFYLGSPEGNAADLPPLFLKLGEQRVLPLPRFQRYSISGTAIRYTRLSGENQLLIKGVSTGMSTLLLTYPHHTSTRMIRVEAKINSPYPHSLFQALNLLAYTETIDGGTQFILRGVISNLKEAHSIAHLKKRFATYIVDETTLETDWLQRCSLQIAEILKPYPHLKILSHEGTLAIQGVLSNEFAITALTKKIQSIQPLVEFDFQTTKGFSPTLYFKVFLLEVLKKYSSRIGTEIQQPVNVGLAPISSILSTSISASIYALVNRGMVRILSSPELVVKSPGQAELFAGGEMPIRLISRVEDKVVWKNVGLTLKLDVKEYNGDRVRLSIETELNHLNEALTQNNIPGMQTNRIKTQVEGTMGKPLLLSGLLQEDTREKISGLPGLAQIPVLGKLFGSDDFQKDRSELVAILLPYREPPREPMQRISSDIPKGFLPIPRHHIPLNELEKLQASREYPWNVL